MRYTTLPLLLLSLAAFGCAPPVLDASFAEDLKPIDACHDLSLVMANDDDSAMLVFKSNGSLLNKLRQEPRSLSWDIAGDNHPVVFVEQGENLSNRFCGDGGEPDVYRRYHATAGTMTTSLDEAGETLTFVAQGLVLRLEGANQALDPFDLEMQFDVSALR